ncbi:MAG TPA: HEAT repeat domain-containing protein, partial [Actinomycetota bacterium]|nr:HEAT repeat domain-containing protein [Actinomycetota bacterium]
ERAFLAEVARALGPARLAGATAAPDLRRLGAARLLAEEGSRQALEALAALSGDGTEAVRELATAARARVEQLERAERPQAPPPLEVGPEPDRLTALAGELADPDAAVRQRARQALSALERGTVVEWVRTGIRSQDDDLSVLAAGVAEHLGLAEVGNELLERALGVAGEARRPYVRALEALMATGGEEVSAILGRVPPERRPDAVRFLWDATGGAALPVLRSGLVDPSPEVRIAVLDVLRGTGDAEAIRAAETALGADSSPAVRAAAVRVLAAAPAEQRMACLSRSLLDPDASVRATAVELLPEGLGRTAAEILLRALSDLDEGVRRAVLRHVAAFPEEDLPLVWQAFRSAPEEQREQMLAVLERTAPERLARLATLNLAAADPEDRVLAVRLLARVATREAVGAAIQALQDVSADVRRAAADTLGAQRSPQAVPALGRALADPDVEVRLGAVRALGVIDDEAVLGYLVTALRDPAPPVRETASQVLTEWSSPAVAKRLADVLEHPELRGQARDLLVKMGPSAVELLVDVLLQASPAVRPEVGRLLEQIAGRERFQERLASIDPDQRLRSLQALAAIGGPDTVDLLLRGLSDPDERVRIRAAALLGDLGDARAVEPLRRSFLSDPVPEVVAAAEAALARLRDGDRG